MSVLQLCAELRFLRVERNRYGSHPQLEVNVEYVKSRIKEMEESK